MPMANNNQENMKNMKNNETHYTIKKNETVQNTDEISYSAFSWNLIKAEKDIVNNVIGL